MKLFLLAFTAALAEQNFTDLVSNQDPIAPHHIVQKAGAAAVIDTSREKGTKARVVYAEEIVENGAAWLRINFDELSTSLTAGSSVVLTSRLDGAQQHLTAEKIEQWSYSSAYFNGDAVAVEVYARPKMGVLQVQNRSHNQIING